MISQKMTIKKHDTKTRTKHRWRREKRGRVTAKTQAKKEKQQEKRALSSGRSTFPRSIQFLHHHHLSLHLRHHHHHTSSDMDSPEVLVDVDWIHESRERNSSDSTSSVFSFFNFLVLQSLYFLLWRQHQRESGVYMCRRTIGKEY